MHDLVFILVIIFFLMCNNKIVPASSIVLILILLQGSSYSWPPPPHIVKYIFIIIKCRSHNIMLILSKLDIISGLCLTVIGTSDPQRVCVWGGVHAWIRRQGRLSEGEMP